MTRWFVWMIGYEYNHMLEVVKNTTAADLDDIEDTDEMLWTVLGNK